MAWERSLEAFAFRQGSNHTEDALKRPITLALMKMTRSQETVREVD